MTFETALIFAISLTLLWIKPGPGQVFKITRALNGGFFAAFYIVSGIICACVIFFLIAILGLNALTLFFDQIGFVFKLAGAIYLLYIGIKGLRNIDKGIWKGRVDKTHKKKFIENFPAALILTLGNPLPIFFFLGLLPSIIPVNSFELKDIVTGVFIIIAVGLFVDTLLILLVTQAKEALSNKKLVRKINVTTSFSFILLGLFFVYSALFMSSFSFDLL